MRRVGPLLTPAGAGHFVHDEVILQDAFHNDRFGERLHAGGGLLADIQRLAAHPSVRDVFDLRVVIKAGFGDGFSYTVFNDFHCDGLRKWAAAECWATEII
jgi:hypothetical protein